MPGTDRQSQLSKPSIFYLDRFRPKREKANFESFFVPLLRRRRFGRIFQPIKKCHKFRKIIFGSRKLFFKIRRQNKLCDTNIRFLHFYSTEETTIFRNLLMGESPCNDFWKFETLAGIHLTYPIYLIE